MYMFVSSSHMYLVRIFVKYTRILKFLKSMVVSNSTG